jgi:hypothetical protein
LLIAPFAIIIESYGDVNKHLQDQTTQYMASILEKYNAKSVHIISPYIQLAFPLINYKNIAWNSSNHSIQMLEGAINSDCKVNKAVQKWLINDQRSVLKHHPEYIFEFKPKQKLLNNEVFMLKFHNCYYNYVDFLIEDDAFKKLWSRYTHLESLEYDDFIINVYYANKTIENS